ncbi:MAG: NHLP bacteriocin system secretion protein [Clostridiaceae bacterium]|nr:NHLP bacteriocin system secretion protein [Clostridiaceae bacterium]
MSNQIFRKVSLDRLSSPEELDQLITVTNPRGWLALLGVAGILFTAVVWGFLGNIPTQTKAMGILTTSGGVMSVTNIAPGKITDVGIRPGDYIKKGDVVARIDQSELVDRINNYKKEIQLINSFDVYNFDKDKESLTSSHSDLYALAREIRLKEGSLGNKQGEQNLLNLEQLKSQLEELKYTKLNEINIALDKDRNSLVEKSTVVSGIYGKVLEVYVKKGDIIQAGTPIISVARDDRAANTLEVVVYVQPEVGKKIQSGMIAHISPTIVKVEDHGFMLGEVASVSEYPFSFQSLLQYIGNKELAQKLAGDGAPIEVRINLIQDATTFSGYKWSTAKGPEIKIDSGNICNGTIIIDNRRPIDMVIPFFKGEL